MGRALIDRHADARRTYERLLSIRNDVGLLSEMYDPAGRRLLGNFPQAFSHVGLVNTALNLSPQPGPADTRPKSLAAMSLSVCPVSPSPPYSGERGWGEGVFVSDAKSAPSPPTPLQG